MTVQIWTIMQSISTFKSKKKTKGEELNCSQFNYILAFNRLQLKIQFSCLKARKSLKID